MFVCTYDRTFVRTGQPEISAPAEKAAYHEYLKGLGVKALYDTIVDVMTSSQECWPADGPQDGDVPNYAGFFGRLAWRGAGTIRV